MAFPVDEDEIPGFNYSSDPAIPFEQLFQFSVTTDIANTNLFEHNVNFDHNLALIENTKSFQLLSPGRNELPYETSDRYSPSDLALVDDWLRSDNEHESNQQQQETCDSAMTCYRSQSWADQHLISDEESALQATGRQFANEHQSNQQQQATGLPSDTEYESNQQQQQTCAMTCYRSQSWADQHLISDEESALQATGSQFGNEHQLNQQQQPNCHQIIQQQATGERLSPATIKPPKSNTRIHGIYLSESVANKLINERQPWEERKEIGIRFIPNDKVLGRIYFDKLSNCYRPGNIVVSFFKEKNVYAHEPSKLSGMPHEFCEGKMYFFVHLKKIKSAKSGIPKPIFGRTAPGGYWQINGPTSSIAIDGEHNSEGISVLKTPLAFYKKDKKEKTLWRMNEYLLANKVGYESSENFGEKSDDSNPLALCVVYFKHGGKQQNQSEREKIYFVEKEQSSMLDIQVGSSLNLANKASSSLPPPTRNARDYPSKRRFPSPISHRPESPKKLFNDSRQFGNEHQSNQQQQPNCHQIIQQQATGERLSPATMEPPKSNTLIDGICLSESVANKLINECQPWEKRKEIGVRFIPKDEVLVRIYFDKLFSCYHPGNIVLSFFKDINVYAHEPSELSGMPHEFCEGKMYFFVHLKKLKSAKCSISGIPKPIFGRTAPGGCWKKNGPTSPIAIPIPIDGKHGSERLSVWKTPLAFYKKDKKSCEEEKTPWRMNEYVLANKVGYESSENFGEKSDDSDPLALCVVYFKNDSKQQKQGEKDKKSGAKRNEPSSLSDMMVGSPLDLSKMQMPDGIDDNQGHEYFVNELGSNQQQQLNSYGPSDQIIQQQPSDSVMTCYRPSQPWDDRHLNFDEYN